MFFSLLRGLAWGTGLLMAVAAAAVFRTAPSEPHTAAVPPPVLVPAIHKLSLPAADNPAVPAGKVRWHASFEDACTAAKKSGKPVLLFHMMGQLDRQFC